MSKKKGKEDKRNAKTRGITKLCKTPTFRGKVEENEPAMKTEMAMSGR